MIALYCIVILFLGTALGMGTYYLLRILNQVARDISVVQDSLRKINTTLDAPLHTKPPIDFGLDAHGSFKDSMES